MHATTPGVEYLVSENHVINKITSDNLKADSRPATLLVKKLQRNLIEKICEILERTTLQNQYARTSEMESVFNKIARIDYRLYQRKAFTKKFCK